MTVIDYEALNLDISGEAKSSYIYCELDQIGKTVGKKSVYQKSEHSYVRAQPKDSITTTCSSNGTNPSCDLNIQCVKTESTDASADLCVLNADCEATEQQSIDKESFSSLNTLCEDSFNAAIQSLLVKTEPNSNFLVKTEIDTTDCCKIIVEVDNKVGEPYSSATATAFSSFNEQNLNSSGADAKVKKKVNSRKKGKLSKKRQCSSPFANRMMNTGHFEYVSSKVNEALKSSDLFNNHMFTEKRHCTNSALAFSKRMTNNRPLLVNSNETWKSSDLFNEHALTDKRQCTNLPQRMNDNERLLVKPTVDETSKLSDLFNNHMFTRKRYCTNSVPPPLLNRMTNNESLFNNANDDETTKLLNLFNGDRFNDRIQQSTVINDAINIEKSMKSNKSKSTCSINNHKDSCFSEFDCSSSSKKVNGYGNSEKLIFGKIDYNYFCRTTFLNNINTSAENVVDFNVEQTEKYDRSKPSLSTEIDGLLVPQHSLTDYSLSNSKRIIQDDKPTLDTEKVSVSSKLYFNELPVLKGVTEFKCIKTAAKVSDNATEMKTMKHPQVQCHLCKKMCDITQKYRHSIFHLNNVAWLFKCLLCGKTTMNERYIRHHINRLHDISYTLLKCGVHYIERMSLYKEEIDRILHLAFNRKAKTKESTIYQHCRLCKTYVTPRELYSHIVNHLPEEIGVKWYKCLLCNKFRSTHRNNVRHHMILKHQMNCIMEEGVHFFTQRIAFWKEFNRIRLIAFPQAVKEKSICKDLSHCKQQQCKLCGRSTIKLQRKTAHACLHLPDTHGIDWFYKCMLCNDFQTLHPQRINLFRHLIIMHNLKMDDIQLDKHYLDRKMLFKNQIAEVRLLAFPPEK